MLIAGLKTRTMLVAAAMGVAALDTPAPADDGKVQILSAAFAEKNEFASGWIGSYVYDAESGAVMGEIRDLVLTSGGKAVSHAVLDMGASLGIGKTLVVVPLSRITFAVNGDQRRILTDINKSDLIEAATVQ